MRILQIIPYPLDRYGGVQTNARDLSAWYREQGHDAMILCPGNVDNELEGEVITTGPANDVMIHGTGFEISFLPPARLRSTVNRLLGMNIDIVHLHTPWTPLMPWQIWRKLKLPSVATFHATLPNLGRKAPADLYIRFAARYFHGRLQALVVPSAAPREQWAALGLDPLPMILPPTIDLQAWREAEHSERPPGPLRFIYLGRFEPRKGVPTLLSAWPEIARALPGAELVLAGTGDLPEDTIAALSTNYGKLPRIVHAPDRATARALVAEADILVAPAEYGESFGLVLIEAMAAGTIPVAAANAGYATVMTDLGSNLLFPPGDAGALVARAIELGEKQELQDRMRQWGLQKAMAYDVRTIGPYYLDLYEKVLIGKPVKSIHD